jgi:putative sigma-54 modulation protein
MHITVKGKNFDVPTHIRDEAVAKLSKVRRLFDRFLDMEVVFSEESNPRIADKYRCEVVLYTKGRSLRAAATAPDPLTAIDRAQSKLQRQTRKLKTRVIQRSRGGAPDPALRARASLADVDDGDAYA